MAPSVTIVATGARTPLGLRAAPTAAAVRAGINRLAEHPFMIDRVGEPMPGALDSRLDPALIGPQRLLELAAPPLREASAPFAGFSARKHQVPVYLGLPEIRPGFTTDDARAVQLGLSRLGGLPVQISDVLTFTEGHAAGLMALSAAASQIQAGGLDVCLVGGVDSYFHPDTMEWLDKNRQLAGSISRAGFIPGEGAGFCLLMSENIRRELGLSALGRVLKVALGRETKLIKTSDICLGIGLTAAVRDAVSGLNCPAETVNDVICDMTSERYRGEEWGFVCLRLPQYFDNPTAYLAPADCWGDMGAASGPLFAMLACEAAARGYATGPRTLLWASSECGKRAAALLGFETGAKAVRGGPARG